MARRIFNPTIMSSIDLKGYGRPTMDASLVSIYIEPGYISVRMAADIARSRMH